MKRTIKAGSRDSILAVIQSRIILELINKKVPELGTELITMKTTGDKILDRTLDKVGGKGLFVKELDRALLSGEVDITIHSLKDLPADIPDGIKIAAYSERSAPEDVLILPEGKEELDYSLPIGCASKRRMAQLNILFPDIDIKPVRGNIQTRLSKLDSGQYGGLVLAKAGIVRLGLEKRISREFTPEEILPAAGQGIIAVECREEDDFDFLEKINDYESSVCAAAERSFICAMDGGCTSPSAAYCKVDGNSIVVTGMDVRDGKIIKKSVSGAASEAEKLGLELAKMIIGSDE